MKKASLFVLFLILNSCLSFAQSIGKGNHKLVSRSSAEIPLLKKFEFPSFNYSKEGNAFVFSQITNKAFALTMVDKAFKTATSSKTFKELGLENEAYHVLTFENSTGVYSLIMEYDKPNKKCTLSSFKIDVAQNSWTKTAKLFTIKAITSRPVGMSYDVRNYFDECYSPDSSKLLVKYTYPPEEKINSKNKSVIGYALLDLSGEPKALWNKDIRMPYTENRITFNGMTLDNKDRLFEQIIVKSDDKDDRKQGLNSSEIIYINQEEGEAKRIGIAGTKKGYMFKTNLTRDGKGRPVVTGCFNTQLEGDAEEFFLAYLNEDDMSFSDFKYIEIPKSVYSQKSPYEKSPEPMFFLKEFYFDKKGDCYILACLMDEWKYLLNYTRIWYGNYFIFKVNQKGDLEWQKTIPYESASTTAENGDYFFNTLNGNLYFGYFNDDSKSVLSKNAKIWENGQWNSYFIKVNSDGTLTKSKTGNWRDLDYFFKPYCSGLYFEKLVKDISQKGSFKVSVEEMKE
jgi:hypothetical protein